MALDLNHKSILVTGGTGSFGKKFVEMVYARFPQVKRLVIYSRDELKQFEMSQEFSPDKHKALRYFIGDVRDEDRLRRALEGIEIVVHAAALKQVPAAEYNPFECIKTNVLGAQNIIEACLDSDVRKVVALSTDKAAAPINLYGATKLCSDKLFTTANNIIGSRDLTFSVVRYGNVMGSRGSVMPFFLARRASGVFPITDPEMTRFNISLDEGVQMVLWALENALGGEIFVPKIPSYRILDLAEAIGPECEIEVVGIRPGEKLHEVMITEDDARNTIDLSDRYVIEPAFAFWNRDSCGKNLQSMPEGFRYGSDNNPERLTADQVRDILGPDAAPAPKARAVS